MYKERSVGYYLKRINGGVHFDSILKKFTWKEILYYLDMNTKYIKYIPPVEKYQIILLAHNRYWFKFLTNPNENVMLYGVTINKNAISYIENPSNDVVIKSIENSPGSIKKVNNVTDEQLKLAWEYEPNLEKPAHLRTYKNISSDQVLWFMNKIHKIDIEFEHKVLYYYKSSKYHTCIFYSDGKYHEYKVYTKDVEFLGNKALAVLASRVKNKEHLAKLSIKYKSVELEKLK